MSIRVNKIFVCLLMLMLLCGCTRNFEINDPAKVTIQRADECIEITDPDTINKLTEQITSMTFKRGQSTKDIRSRMRYNLSALFFSSHQNYTPQAVSFPEDACVIFQGLPQILRQPLK